jgi:hypothetical protein
MDKAVTYQQPEIHDFGKKLPQGGCYVQNATISVYH